ncbi:hypothetical protein J6590_004032 [Homalodisca vitripennis]|nr:hypothetical protein J6590_004032 [Homalodisca vitripennis]
MSDVIEHRVGVIRAGETRRNQQRATWRQAALDQRMQRDTWLLIVPPGCRASARCGAVNDADDFDIVPFIPYSLIPPVNLLVDLVRNGLLVPVFKQTLISDPIREKHLHTLGVTTEDSRFRLCNQLEKTSKHIIIDRERLDVRLRTLFGTSQQGDEFDASPALSKSSWGRQALLAEFTVHTLNGAHLRYSLVHLVDCRERGVVVHVMTNTRGATRAKLLVIAVPRGWRGREHSKELQLTTDPQDIYKISSKPHCDTQSNEGNTTYTAQNCSELGNIPTTVTTDHILDCIGSIRKPKVSGTDYYYRYFYDTDTLHVYRRSWNKVTNRVNTTDPNPLHLHVWGIYLYEGVKVPGSNRSTVLTHFRGLEVPTTNSYRSTTPIRYHAILSPILIDT